MNKLKIILFGLLIIGLTIWAVIYILNYESRLKKIEIKLKNKTTMPLEQYILQRKADFIQGIHYWGQPDKQKQFLDSIDKSDALYINSQDCKEYELKKIQP